jgi:hypothetical protein
MYNTGEKNINNYVVVAVHSAASEFGPMRLF